MNSGPEKILIFDNMTAFQYKIIFCDKMYTTEGLNKYSFEDRVKILSPSGRTEKLFVGPTSFTENILKDRYIHSIYVQVYAKKNFFLIHNWM